MVAVVRCRPWTALGQSSCLKLYSSPAHISMSSWRQSGLTTRPAQLQRLAGCQPLSLRWFLQGGVRTFQHMSGPEHVSAFSTTVPPSPTSRPKHTTPKPEPDIPTAAEQRRNDWIIAKRLMFNVWPKNDWKTRLTVLFGFGLLVTAKVKKNSWMFFFYVPSSLG